MTEAPTRVPASVLRSPVTVRSIGLGLVGVVFVCGLAPYNDYVMNNTYLVGNFLPIGLLLFFIIFVMAINAPLLRWFPRQALTGGELAVALAMTLISCGLPSSGLMRCIPANLVGIPNQAGICGKITLSLVSTSFNTGFSLNPPGLRDATAPSTVQFAGSAGSVSLPLSAGGAVPRGAGQPGRLGLAEGPVRRRRVSRGDGHR